MTRKAYLAGQDAGQASGSWVIDGNTDEETALHILQGIADGDPEIMDMAPAPLSGEWAGESIPELSDRYNVDLFNEYNADQYELGYSDGFWAEVERSARAVTS